MLATFIRHEPALLAVTYLCAISVLIECILALFYVSYIA